MPQDLLSIDDLLEQMVARGASDLHLSAGAPPTLRVRGEMIRLEELGSLMPADTQQLLYRVLSSEQQKRLEIDRQLDLSHAIPEQLKTLEELRLPATLHEFATQPRGLVLVTGPTGSGKSTTLAALIDEINRTRAEHILTIEDPIEFVHRHKRSLVNQREIGPDARTFAEALRAVLRQDPDVILLGEMRDLETIARMIDVFPAEQQEQVRVQIATSLQGVVTQALLPTADGSGRVPALEILIPDDAIRNLIRQGKVEQIYSVMQTASSRGMQTMEQSLAELVMRGVISKTVALGASSRRDQLEGLLERAGFAVPGERAQAPLAAGPRV